MSRWNETSRSEKTIIVVVVACALAACCGCVILGTSIGAYSLSRDSGASVLENSAGILFDVTSASTPSTIQPPVTPTATTTLTPTTAGAKATETDDVTATPTPTVTASPTPAVTTAVPPTPQASATTAIGNRPVAVIDGPTQATIGQAITFSAQDSGAADGSEIVGYEWEFGDGGAGSGITATHVYSAAGEYGVRLAVADDAGLSGYATLRLRIQRAGATTEPPPAPNQSGIEGVDWMLEGVLEGTTISLLFAAGSASGEAGCNEYGGWYEAGDERISISITSIGYDVCDEETMAQETGYLLALAAADSYQLQGDRLTIAATLDGQGVDLAFTASGP